jgi:mono/diheme cytochrome c family protein
MYRSVLLGLAMMMAAGRAQAADELAQRGKYLAQIIGCTDCHTPGTFLGHPDMTNYLGGSDVGFAVPGLGVFVAPNLTSDKETGLGNWSMQQIIAAITTGVRPDGRTLAPIMPVQDFKHLTKQDAQAIAAYLKSLPPISHQVPGPFPAGETPSVFVMAVMPGDVYAGLSKPK